MSINTNMHNVCKINDILHAKLHIENEVISWKYVLSITTSMLTYSELLVTCLLVLITTRGECRSRVQGKMVHPFDHTLLCDEYYCCGWRFAYQWCDDVYSTIRENKIFHYYSSLFLNFKVYTCIKSQGVTPW